MSGMATKPLPSSRSKFKLTVPRCRLSHIYKCCQSLRRGNRLIVCWKLRSLKMWEKTFTARSRMIWSLDLCVVLGSTITFRTESDDITLPSGFDQHFEAYTLLLYTFTVLTLDVPSLRLNLNSLRDRIVFQALPSQYPIFGLPRSQKADQ
jgi:hypothetical protein